MFACITAQTTMEDNDDVVSERSFWSKPLLEGFLLKKGQGINLGLKKRWFVLSEGRIYYYKTSDVIHGSELGFIDLTGTYNIIHSPTTDPCHFRINTPQRLWYLTAEAEEECRFWVDGLSSYKKRQKRQSRCKVESFAFEEDDSVDDLKSLLNEAEMEIEANKIHIDELYKDLQNSIQIIKLKNDQIDLLTTRLAEKDGSDPSDPDFRRRFSLNTLEIEEEKTDENINGVDIHDFDDIETNDNSQQWSKSYDDRWKRSSYEFLRTKTIPKNVTVASKRTSSGLQLSRNSTIKREKIEDSIEEFGTEEELLAHLKSSMGTFMEYLADDEHGKSSRIAISVWMKTVSTYIHQIEKKKKRELATTL